MRRLAFLSLLLACGHPAREPPFIVRVALWGPLGTLTPESGNTGSLAVIAQPLVFEPLARFDANGGLVPVAAARIDATSQHRCRVWLRKESTFSDGAPLTEEDVVASFAGKARVTLDEGALAIESLDAGMPIDILITTVMIHRGSGAGALGTGPFVVASASGSEIRMVRRRPAPHGVSEVRLVPYATPQEAFAHTLKGDANLLVDLDPRWLEFFRGVPTLQLVRSPGVATDAVAFSMKLPRSERKALAALLETDEVRNAAYGTGECAEPPGADATSVRLPAGPKLGILTWGPFERLGRVVRRALGPRAGELVHLPPRDELARIRSRNFDLMTLRPLSWPPAALSLNWHSGVADNPNGYSNPAVDHALDAHDWRAARAALRDDPPAAFICTRDRVAVMDARIRNPAPGSGDLMETLSQWEVSQ